MMRCPYGHELVEVDNPFRREVRHRRGVVCTERASNSGGSLMASPTSAITWMVAAELAAGQDDGEPWLSPAELARIITAVDRVRAEPPDVRQQRHATAYASAEHSGAG